MNKCDNDKYIKDSTINQKNMEETKIPKRLLIIGNGFDLDLGRNTRYSDFAKSEFWPKNLKSQLYRYLSQKSQIEKWFDLEGELANYVQKMENTVSSYRALIPATAQEDAQDFKIIVASMISYLQSVQRKNVKTDTLAAKVFSLACENSTFSKIYSFNYTDLNIVARQFLLPEMSNIEYVHGCLADNSAILGINDQVDTVDGAYDFMRKSFNQHYSSHPVGFDLRDADEVVFYGHSLGDNDYHYFQSFFKHQCEENLEKSEQRMITIFTYNEASRMEIMRTLHKMNNGRTSMLFQNNELNIFCTHDEEHKMSDTFLNWYQNRKNEILQIQTKEFFTDI